MKKIILVILFLCCSGCKEYRPPSNTPEHKAAHGFVDGEVTEIWVGKTLLSIPPDIHFSPVTSGKIVEGKSDLIRLGLKYPEFEQSDVLNNVIITLRTGYEEPILWNKSFLDEEWKSVKEKDDLKLVEYRWNRESTARGYITYTPIDNKIRTPKGSLIIYRCQGSKIRIDTCLSSFSLSEDLIVQYQITNSLLPHWNRIHNDVVEYVEKLIVK